MFYQNDLAENALSKKLFRQHRWQKRAHNQAETPEFTEPSSVFPATKHQHLGIVQKLKVPPFSS